MTRAELTDFLNLKVSAYNRPNFIESDPVSIPHLFSRKEDIEISAFFAATIAWGQRPVIIRNAKRWMELMDMAPYEFVTGASAKELKRLDGFVHRTFNSTDAKFFVLALRNMYKKHGGMEPVFEKGLQNGVRVHVATRSIASTHRVATAATPKHQGITDAILHFRKTFLSIPHETRSEKHIANPASGSNAKRINMFLRWMVRRDKAGVDFGIWKSISPSLLFCPLDVHVGNTARALGLLERKIDDWKAVEELTANLRALDANDPVKYDFALFGLGVFEKFGG